ncbi:acyl-CoA carboxylase epsilon subunit [Streptomyces sp. NPDC057011]|uniref:acyl-CoA carboxylase epsilon subunit n=1 Tax=unclassified Streptomyces TaxID=2593676 RepID=UPI003627E5B3
MTAGQAAAAPHAPHAPGAPQTWRIVGGDPDATETAAVLAVLTALLLNRSGAPQAEPPRTVPAGWDRRDRAPAGAFRQAGSWRQR